jgi:hypothetical protein
MTNNVVYDVKGLVRDLKNLDPDLKKAMLKEYRKIAKDPNELIKKAIPVTAPMSGMSPEKNHGRSAWGAVKKPDATSIRFRTSGSRKYKVTSLASIWVLSPMTAIADVAGKGSGVPTRSETRPYIRNGKMRSHKVTTQGRNMIAVLRERRKSNFVYPAVEKSLPSVEREIKLILDKYAAKVNRKLG